jgi:hypothetical protein
MKTQSGLGAKNHKTLGNDLLGTDQKHKQSGEAACASKD